MYLLSLLFLSLVRTSALIYIIDSTDVTRMDETRVELGQLLLEKKLDSVPESSLVLAYGSIYPPINLQANRDSIDISTSNFPILELLDFGVNFEPLKLILTCCFTVLNEQIYFRVRPQAIFFFPT